MHMIYLSITRLIMIATLFGIKIYIEYILDIEIHLIRMDT